MPLSYPTAPDLPGFAPRGRGRSALHRRARRLAVLASRLAVLPLAGSVVANLVGSVRLAWLLCSSTLLSAFLAVILWTGVLVAEALLRVVFETPAARSLHLIAAYSEPIRRRLGWAIRLAVFAWWLWAVTGLFLIRERVASAVRALLFTEGTVGQITLSLGGVLAFALTLWVSVQLARWTEILLEEGVLRRVRLPRGAAGTISTMARYGVLTLGFLAAASAAGFQISQLAFIFGALGVGIGFGLQDLVKNFVSGLILAFERPVRVGDAIQAAGLGGKVRKIGIRSSTVRTWDGAEIVVPNGRLIAGELVNWTLSDRLRRLELPVGVAYGSAPVHPRRHAGDRGDAAHRGRDRGLHLLRLVPAATGAATLELADDRPAEAHIFGKAISGPIKSGVTDP